MNLAQTHSELYEYAPCALRDWPDMLVRCKTRKRPGRKPRGPGERGHPLLRTEFQQAIWHAIMHSRKPLTIDQIRQRIHKDFDHEILKLKHALSAWHRHKWLSRVGLDREYAYRIDKHFANFQRENDGK